MKIQLFSDLHLEFHKTDYNFEELGIVPSAPYLFLAGDICCIDHANYNRFIDWVSDKWDHIFLIFGNHEFYSDNLEIDNLKFEVKCYINKYPNIHLLENSTYELSVDDEDVLIVGSIDWTMLPNKSTGGLNDFNRIYKDGDKLSVDGFNQMAMECKSYIDKVLEENREKTIIMCTHFPPTNGTSHLKYELMEQPAICKAYFKNYYDLDDNKYNPVVAWLSGHTHYSYDFEHHNIRCIGNQYGYPDENVKHGDGVYDLDIFNLSNI